MDQALGVVRVRVRVRDGPRWPILLPAAMGLAVGRRIQGRTEAEQAAPPAAEVPRGVPRTEQPAPPLEVKITTRRVITSLVRALPLALDIR